MAYMLGLLILWMILFLPVGLAFHWAALGVSGRLQALPVALVTGLACAVIVLAAAGQAGIDVSQSWVPIALLAISVACAIAIWRRNIEWRSRPLVGAALLIFAGMVLLQLPVWGIEQSGPLGYGTGHEPVTETAAVRAIANGGELVNPLAKRSVGLLDGRFVGFEQLAGFTTAAGTTKDLRSSWNAYSLLSPMLGVLALLTMLPLLVFTLWRGMGTAGVIVTAIIGAMSPVVMLNLGLSQTAGITALPFAVTLMVALLMARRDRGWYAVAAASGGAVLVTVGPLGLLPALVVAATWGYLGARTHEHLAHTDKPVGSDRTLICVALCAMVAIYASAAAMLDHPALRWQRVHDDLLGSVASWPFNWLDTEAAAASPENLAELALWLIGPALLGIAIAYGIARRETRELSIVTAVLVSVAVGVAIAAFDSDVGGSLVEYSWLVTAPLLIAVCVRVAGLSRALGAEKNSGRLVGRGPTALIVLLVGVSIASSIVTGSRFTHAPSAGDRVDGARTLILAPDPWLEYLVDGEHPPSSVADPDELAEGRGEQGIALTYDVRYAGVLVSNDPFGSDPPAAFVEQNETVGQFAVRLFSKRGTASAKKPKAKDAADAAAAAAAAAPDPQLRPASERYPRRHEALEIPDTTGAAGLLLPRSYKPLCAALGTTCTPPKPEVSGQCPAGLLKSGTFPRTARFDVDSTSTGIAGQGAATGQGGTTGQVQNTGQSQTGAPVGGATDGAIDSGEPLVAIACFTVELDGETTWLRTHVRDVGLVLEPRLARHKGDGSSKLLRRRLHGPDKPAVLARTLPTQGSQLLYGTGLANQPYEVVLEGLFATGAQVSSGATGGATAVTGDIAPAPGGWSQKQLINPDAQGSLVLENTSGTRLLAGRMVARPGLTVPRSCNISLPVKPKARAKMLDGQTWIDVRIVEISGAGGDRVATVAAASYVQELGRPHHVLLDWVEQYSGPVSATTCLGDPF